MQRIQRHNTVSVLRIAAVTCGIIAITQLPGAPARAQLMDQLKGAAGSAQGGNSNGGMLGGLGGGGVPSVGQASPSNTAGVLQYCIQNKYVGAGGASSVKDSLMRKMTGSGRGANDSGYKAGSSGLLQTGNGQNFSLGGDGVKAQLTQKVCDQVLAHAKSLL
jgi:Protein of unknown function (DUF2501)